MSRLKISWAQALCVQGNKHTIPFLSRPVTYSFRIKTLAIVLAFLLDLLFGNHPWVQNNSRELHLKGKNSEKLWVPKIEAQTVLWVFFFASRIAVAKHRRCITLWAEIMYIIQCLYLLDFLLQLMHIASMDKQVSSCHTESTSDINTGSVCNKPAKINPSFTCWYN